MKKMLLAVLMLSLIFSNICVFAEDVEINVKSVVVDPVEKVIVMTGNINLGPDRTIFATMQDENGTVVYMKTALSNSEGDFSLSMGVGNLTGSSYNIYLQYKNTGKYKAYEYHGIDSVKSVKLKAAVTKNYIFMEDDTNIDFSFNTANIKLENATAVTGEVLPENYEVTGLPDGMTTSLTAISNDTLELMVGGKASQPITADVSIELRLKSGMIFQGLANTTSDIITGITIYSSAYASRPQFLNSSVSFHMNNYRTPAGDEGIIKLKYRNLDVDGALEYGSDYTYTGTQLKGISLKAVANKGANSIQLTLSGSANTDIKNDIEINDLVFSPSIAEGANLPSSPIRINLYAADGESYVKGGSGGGGGGGNGMTLPPIITPPNTVAADPIVPVVPSILNDLSGHWAEEYVEKMNRLGYIKGYEGNQFMPDRTISRAEFVTLIARVLNLTAVKYDSAFKDVVSEDWYAKQVQASLDAGIISQAEYFRPNDNITRDEITKIAVEAYLSKKSLGDLNISVSLNTFKDADEFESWARDYIQEAVNIGIVSGYDTGEFLAKNSATRAEAVTILARLVDFLK